LLHAFSESCLTGVALAALGVAVVAGGLSAAKATLQPRAATTARTAILIQASNSKR
jgi:hypothetical protein